MLSKIFLAALLVVPSVLGAAIPEVQEATAIVRATLSVLQSDACQLTTYLGPQVREPGSGLQRG